MKIDDTIKPTPYSPTDGVENLAVYTFSTLIDNEKVKLDIKTRDKIPNIDGYFELVDEKLHPIGKFEIQVKKLPKNNIKLKVKTSFLSYCEGSILPVILVGVDIDNRKAYWLHIDENFTKQISIKSSQKSKTINFSKENLIDGQQTGYFNSWIGIILSRKNKFQKYDDLKKSYDILSTNSNQSIGQIKTEFQNIHCFLDEFNNLLNNDFLIVKKRLFPNTWKIGLAYYKYGEREVSFTLYPIPHNKNDVEIKEINEILRNQLKREGLGFTAHYIENPIESRPNEYATEEVRNKVSTILKYKLLNHGGSHFLAKEFIFGFVDKFHLQLGLEIKNEYTIEEIESAFYHYLAVWVDEAIKIIIAKKRNNRTRFEDCLHRNNTGVLPFFDPEDLSWMILRDELDIIKNNVTKRLKEETIYNPLPLNNESFPFGVFVEFFSFLKNQGVKKIERIYLKKDYSRLEESNWTWNVYSTESIEQNLKVFFKNLLAVYYNLLSQNFPLLKEKLPLFRGASRIVVTFDVKKVNIYRDPPMIQILYLRNEEENDIKIDVYKKGDVAIPDISSIDFYKGIKLDRIKYDVISGSSGVLNFIYDDLPMYNYIYKLLEENLNSYFDQISSNS